MRAIILIVGKPTIKTKERIMNNKTEIMNILMRVNRKMFTRGPRQGGERFGRSQVQLIKEIINNPGISQDQLAEILSLDKTTVAKAVKKLEEHEMVVRTKSTQDSRKYEITASEKAVAIKDQHKDEFDKRSNLLFEGINDEELSIFSTTLGKIELNIEKNRGEMKIDNNRIRFRIARIILHEPGISEEKIMKQLEMSKGQLDKALEGMKERGWIEIKNDGIYPTEKAKDRQQMALGRRPGRPRKSMGAGRPGGRQPRR